MARVACALSIIGTTILGCGHDRGQRVDGHSVDRAASTDASTSILAGTPMTSPLLPRPRSTKPASCERPFVIDASTRIAIDDTPESRAMGEQLARWLGLTSQALAILPSGAPDPTTGIVLRAGPTARDPGIFPPSTLDEEAYTLDVSQDRAVVHGRTRAGTFYGAQTIAQLAGARRVEDGTTSSAKRPSGRLSVPCQSIDDAPRFRFRAMHLDVARHFFPKAVVRRYIDLLAFYRFNVFHWHLTDDQGFRLEVKSHPELTAVGGRDGSYTQEDAREIIQYARDRSITVIPEIELPGHARAILAAHPELSCTGKQQEVPRTWGIFEDVLCAGNEKTYVLLDDVLGEVAPLFPSQLIHVGGDEVPTTRWKACAKCRAAMKANNVGLDELEGHVIRRVASTLEKHGKRPLVWDEAMEGLAGTSSTQAKSTPESKASKNPSDAVIVAWQSAARGREAARRGFDVVMAPNEHVYLNFFQSRARTEPGHSGYLPWSLVRTFDPLAESTSPANARIIGGEGALWTEFVATPEDIEVMVVPRAAALAESLWSGPAPSEEDFIARFNAQLPMLDASRVRYFIDPPEGAPKRKILVEGETATLTFSPPRLFPNAVIRWTRDGSDPTPTSPSIDAPLTVRETSTISAATFLPGGRSSPVVRSSIVVERPRPAVSVPSTEKGVLYTYAEGDFHQLPDFAKIREMVKARGRVANVTLAALGTKLRAERFAVLFEGLVFASADGVHRFVVRADDGIRLEIDGEKILEDDGEHEPRESSGEIALARGLHRVRITYFQGTEGKELDVKLEGPNLPLAPLAITTESPAKR
jgi:hexosaminidase